MAYAGEESRSPLTPTAPNLHPNESPTRTQNAASLASPVYEDFENLHHQANAMVQKGLKADEKGDVAAARQYYIHSLSLLEQVLTADCHAWRGASQDKIEAAEEMQRKMSKMKLQVDYRMESMQSGEESSSSTGVTSQGEVMNGDETSSNQACGETSSALHDTRLLPETGDRVPGLTSLGSEAGEGVKLPSYEEAISSGPSSPVSSTGSPCGGMTAMTPGDPRPLVTDVHGERLSADGTELFCIADGVQIYFISCEGCVSAPSYPTALYIVRLEQESMERDGGWERGVGGAPPSAFLRVGDWVYPLIPEASPILHTAFGAYLFPDLSPDGSGSSVGLMLPDTLSQEESHLLEDILRNFSNVQEQQPLTPTDQEDDAIAPPSSPPPGLQESQDAVVPRTERGAEDGEGRCAGGGAEDQSTSAVISRGILIASSWISWGLGKGAEKAGQWIAYGSEKLRDNMRPDTQPTTVDPRVQKGVQYARKASNCAVSVSSYIVTKLGEATVALGRTVAPHIRKKGEEIMPPSMKTEENKSRLHGVAKVAASGLQGFSTVWLSLEAAAKALGRSVATETVATVQHKFGQDAGKLAENTVYTAGNVAMTAYTAESLAAKAIAKRAARETGTAVVKDLKGESGEQEGWREGECGEEEEEEEKKSEKMDKKLPL